MKTISIQAYQINKLSDKAKQNAINSFRENESDSEQYCEDAHQSIKKFHDIFGTKEGFRSWLDVRTGHINDNIMNLKGLRLRTYIWNNFGKDLYKRKYYSLFSKKDISYKYYKEGHAVLKYRYSKIMFEHEAVLTGMCYDDDILKPVYEFLDWKLRPDYNSYMDFETLMNDCFSEMRSVLESEVEDVNSDESIIDRIEDLNYLFDQTGKKIEEE